MKTRFFKFASSKLLIKPDTVHGRIYTATLIAHFKANAHGHMLLLKDVKPLVPLNPFKKNK